MDMTALYFGKAMSDASGGGSAVQSDYLQNDSSAKDYIKNRPFYSEITTEIDTNIIIPSQEVEGETLDEGFEGYMFFSLNELDSDSIKKMASITNKGQYNLTIDGKPEHISTVYNPGRGSFLFGDLSILGIGDSTGEPYTGEIAVEYDERDGYIGNFELVFQTTETTHTIGLSHIGDVVPIIAKDTYSFETIEGSTGHYFTNMWEASFEGDNVYNLTFDDESYEGLSWVHHKGSGVDCLGNLSIAGIGVDTKEKCLLVKEPQDNGSVELAIITSCEAGNYTVSLEKSLVKTIETIHKMDSKYIDTPYTEDAAGNAIFEKDIYINNETSVSQSFKQITEINTKLDGIEKTIIEQEENITETRNTIEDLPRPLVKGVVVTDAAAGTDYGLSAGSGYPNGTFAWSEGSSGATLNDVRYSIGCKLVIKKGETPYIQYTMMATAGAWTAEDHIANLEKYAFLKIKFYDEQKNYFIKRREVTAENSTIKIQFSFLPYEDKFDISEPTSGREIAQLTTIETLGDYSHSEGVGTKAKGTGAHSEGYYTEALGSYSHAEGYTTKASGTNSHAEGYTTEASGTNSHAEGNNTKASGTNSHVQGKYNKEDTENKYAHIVGNGESNIMRSNAHTIDWDGNAWYAGKVTSKDISLEDEEGNTILESLIDTVNELKNDSGKINVSGATAGQIVQISEVDDNGVPTAWESVDFPSTEEEWEHICDIEFVTDEEVTVVKQDLGAEYRKLLLYVNKNSAGGLTSGGGDSYQLSIRSGVQEISRVLNSANKEWAIHTFQIEWIQNASKFISEHSCNQNAINTCFAGHRTTPFSELSFHTDGVHTDGAIFTFGNFTMNVYGVRI